jgi:hypothetical protein
METKEVLVELDQSLHSPNVRRSRANLESLLSDRFVEIGASGERHGRAQVIEAMLNEGESPAIQATDFECHELSPGTVLLIYQSRTTLRGETPRYARRSSIWRREGDRWRIIFHQCTVTGPCDAPPENAGS